MHPDAIIFTINELHLSAGQQRAIVETIDAVTDTVTGRPSRLVRLQGSGDALGRVLDELAEAGFQTIRVQPLGLPFSQSLAAWLPGALAHWLAGWQSERGDAGPTLLLGSDQSTSLSVMERVVREAAGASGGVRVIDPAEARLGKPGWQEPPPFKHHLLVCAGPRCHFRDAADLRTMLKDALLAAGHDRDCLLTTTGCLFPCNRGPMVAVYPRGEWYRLPDPASVQRFVDHVIGAGRTLDDLLIHSVATPEPDTGPSCQATAQAAVLTG